MLAPGRRLIWATCPSTHTHPSLATHAPTFWLTTRTGHGSSGVLLGVSGCVTLASLCAVRGNPGLGQGRWRGVARTMAG
ncbi:hypothetical protein GCM10023170_057090 [Phytohabitans houttuyneae]|uniref:Uncharacterized protein n=1 Tax=Phytohabitans houttuyneae TaxID=1076126 RepID=A0A6V8KEW4_9ACTN|nr:hypothetical protein Phou_047990 [Phytohabitans houttuyneae]